MDVVDLMSVSRPLLVALGLCFTAALGAVATGQRPTAEGQSVTAKSTLPRTAWGDPDLQGVWSSTRVSDVPFERPPSMGSRATLNDEEFAKQLETIRRNEEADRFKTDTNRDGLLAGPDNWRERGGPTRQASLVVDPPNGRLPALTADGARRARQWREGAAHPDGPEDLNPYDRCITRGVLGSAFPNIYNSASRILQTRELVVIYHEMIHETRIIPLDGRPPLTDNIQLYMGDARGRWEGSSLVIETRNFNGKTGSYGRNGNGNPTSRALKLVERYTRTSATSLDYEVTVDDPQTYTAPWRVAFPLTLDPDYTIFEYDCHESNYAVTNMLRGARAVDRER